MSSESNVQIDGPDGALEVDAPLYRMSNGWYFWAEDYAVYGPYPNKHTARCQLENYCAEMLGEDVGALSYQRSLEELMK